MSTVVNPSIIHRSKLVIKNPILEKLGILGILLWVNRRQNSPQIIFCGIHPVERTPLTWEVMENHYSLNVVAGSLFRRLVVLLRS